MPKIVQRQEVPAALKAFAWHGVDLQGIGKPQVHATCFLCGREGKWVVNADTSQWRCLVCGAKGNSTEFLRALWDASDKATTDYAGLSLSRGLLEEDTPMHWGAAKSTVSGEWLVPGYGTDAKLLNLYRWVRQPNSEKHRLWATPGFHHTLFGVTLFDSSRPDVWLCEGIWDAMALWEMLVGNHQHPTASILAVPGCNVWRDQWLPLLAGKRVIIAFDSDHPKEHAGNVTMASLDGVKRISRQLMAAAPKDRCKEVCYLRWGPDGYDPKRPSGYDLRDHLLPGKNMAARQVLVDQVVKLVAPIPQSWLEGVKVHSAGGVKVKPELECLPCDSWTALINEWRKAMRWSDGLDRTLAVMMATVVSTDRVGDQLWCKVIGPPSCGKSTLAEALATAKKYVLPKSTITGFHSGYRETNDQAEDNSLLAEASNKTLVVKDGDALLKMPNLSQILSQARDIYDRVSRTHYRNKASKNYEAISLTVLLCGTKSLRQIDDSELGERFLDCVVVERIDEEEEDEVAIRVGYRAERDMNCHANGTVESQDGKEMVRAKQVTGGYVTWLRTNSHELFANVQSSDESVRLCANLAKLVSMMRARPGRGEPDKAERELCYRLTSQLVRLSSCLTVVLNKRVKDADVMARVARVALDTARGKTLEMTKHMYNAGIEGVTASALAIWSDQGEGTCRALLQFLKRLGAVEPIPQKTGYNVKPRWRLTDRLRRLYQTLVEGFKYDA